MTRNEWALAALAQLQPDEFTNAWEFRRHIHALGQLAGYEPTQLRELATRMWSTSRHASTTGSPPPPADDAALNRGAAAPMSSGRNGVSPTDDSPWTPAQRRGVTPSQDDAQTPGSAVVQGLQGVVEAMQQIAETQSRTAAESAEVQARSNEAHAKALRDIAESVEARKDTAPDDDGKVYSDKFSLLNENAEFAKGNRPYIEDKDPDIDRYEREFNVYIWRA